jgi:tetratricopeptide (TPR) repeat protein
MSDDVQALLSEAAGMPYGEPKSILIERAVREADARHDRELAFQARLDLTTAYQFGGEPVKSFATFSRCLADYDAEPARFGEWRARELLWQFKWIMGDMRKFPEIPLPRVLGALEDMERRFRQAGDLLHAVHAERCRMAWHLGDETGVAEWFHRWRTTPRDELSDCEACDISSQAVILAALGRDEEAVAIADPVVSGRFTCHSQPQGILCTLLPLYVRTGRIDAAADAHRRAYRLVQGKVADLEDFGDHMRFCALTGNETRGLEILRRELPLLDRPPSPDQACRFMAGAAVVLRRLEELGHGHLTVTRAGVEVPVPELRAEMEAGARAIAARFDARNGNDVYSRRVEDRLAATPMIERLPLAPHARRQVTGSPEERWRRGIATSDVRDLEEAVAGFTQRGDGERAALARVDLAAAYLQAGRSLDAAETAEEALLLLAPAAPTAPAPFTGPASPATSTEPAARLDVARRTLATALGALGEAERALAVLRELGDAGALLDAGELLSNQDDDREAAEAFAQAAELFRRDGDLGSAAYAMRRHARMIYYASEHAPEITDAYARARQALEAAGSAPGALLERARLAYEEADALRWLDRRDEAVIRCQDAIDAYRQLDDKDGLAIARDLMEELREQDD